MNKLKLSQLSETLVGSEIVKLGGEIREKIRQGEKIYNFTVGDFDPAIFPIPKELEEEIIDAYRKHFTNYPAAEGNLDLREAISQFIKDRQQLDYQPTEILAACGGRPLIYALFRAVCDKGDKVIYAVPSWNNNHYANFVGAEHFFDRPRAQNIACIRRHRQDARSGNSLSVGPDVRSACAYSLRERILCFQKQTNLAGECRPASCSAR